MKAEFDLTMNRDGKNYAVSGTMSMAFNAAAGGRYKNQHLKTDVDAVGIELLVKRLLATTFHEYIRVAIRHETVNDWNGYNANILDYNGPCDDCRMFTSCWSTHYDTRQNLLSVSKETKIYG